MNFSKKLIIISGLCILSVSNVFCGMEPEMRSDTDSVIISFNFNSQWSRENDRVWIGADYWANPLQDWNINGGRLECSSTEKGRNIQLITHDLGERGTQFRTSVTCGSMDQKPGKAGFRIGLKGIRNEYRFNAIWGKGLELGMDEAGKKLYCFNQVKGEMIREVALEWEAGQEYTLELNCEEGENGVALVLNLLCGEGEEILATLQTDGFSNADLLGNIALFSEGATHWFEDWSAGGDMLQHHPERSWGPILWSQYTLDSKTLKLLAFMAPMGEGFSRELTLQLLEEEEWKSIQTVPMEDLTRTALFRINNWNDKLDLRYRIMYQGNGGPSYREGVIRKNPIEKEVISVAGFTGHKTTNFPNLEVVKNVSRHDPDLLFFSGDQIYEGNGGFGVVRKPLDKSTLCYLSKYYLFGWSFGELMKDRPCVIIPDDHDVFAPNLWGNGGDGYKMPVDFVNMIQRTQTGHLPDPADGEALENGIEVYFTNMTYGRISFAILEDRKFKTHPIIVPEEVRGSPVRPDHVTLESFNPDAVNLEEYTLLGQRQLDFLENWTSDWTNADLKVALSQTTFAGIASHHGPKSAFVIGDYDSNGWPQHGRDRALIKLRKGFAFMYAGDTHLPTIVKHGVEEWADAGWAFCVPSIAAGYPRSWLPGSIGNNHQLGMPDYTGDYKDGFGNKITVQAAANPMKVYKENESVLAGDPEVFYNKMSGYGIVRLDKRNGDITMECYPLTSGPKEEQMEGWPFTINYMKNNGRAAVAYLPELKIEGVERPVVQVVDQSSKETVYTLRLTDSAYRPEVYREGKYILRVGDPDLGVWKSFENVKSSKRTKKELHINFNIQ
jgi:alkaline phosphatase D